MAEIAPFHGLRYDEKVVGDLANVIAPPYDVIPPALQDELHRRSPYNVVRVELGQEEPSDNPVENKYERAKRAIGEWIESGALRIDHAAAFYPYDHYFPFRGERLRRRGLFCALRLYEWGRGVVRPHEQTFAKPKEDRLRLLRLTRVNASAVFLLYDDRDGAVADVLDDVMSHGPARMVADVRADEQRHLLWILDDRHANATLAKLFADKRLYIADGHHRYETALDYWRDEMKAGRVEVENDTPAYVFAYLVSMRDPGLRILPTHRVVRGAEGAIEDAIRAHFDAAPIDAGALENQQPGLAISRDGRLDALAARSDAPLDALPESWRQLPVAQAEELLIRPARDQGAEVSYTHETDAVLAAAREGATGVLLRAVEPETLQRVADAWERLPQKTTYFHPKVPTGLVMRPLGE